jgi:SAM-dependent methyltransferase
MTSPDLPAADSCPYDEAYYERGVKTGVSGYTNYRWRPEYVLPLANELKRRYLGQSAGDVVLDYGCAKGFLVKAFRLLGVTAYGVDISRYAIEHCDPAVKEFLSDGSHLKDWRFGLVVAKDTLEHVRHDDIDRVLRQLKGWTAADGTCVIIVPLGDDGLYRIREFELDKTHIIREDEEWWIGRFCRAGFSVSEFHYNFPNAKDHWLKVHPQGNGTFVLRPEK